MSLCGWALQWHLSSADWQVVSFCVIHRTKIDSAVILLTTFLYAFRARLFFFHAYCLQTWSLQSGTVILEFQCVPSLLIHLLLVRLFCSSWSSLSSRLNILTFPWSSLRVIPKAELRSWLTLFIPRISEHFILQFVLSSLISCSAPFIQLCMFSTKSIFSSLLSVNIPTLLNSLSGLLCKSLSLDAITVELGTFGGVLLSWNVCALCYPTEVHASAAIPLLGLFFISYILPVKVFAVFR